MAKTAKVLFFLSFSFETFKAILDIRSILSRVFIAGLIDVIPNIFCKILMLISRIDALEKKLLKVNLRDQIEVFARRSRKLEYLDELERSIATGSDKKMKTIIVLPAYNASKTLKVTFSDIPKEIVDFVIKEVNNIN